MKNKLQDYKDVQANIFGAISEVLGGISAPVKLKLIHFLSQGPMTVDSLATKIDQSIANTSMHLRKMLAVNLVSCSAQGKFRVYSLNSAVLPFWESLQDLIEVVDPTLKVQFDELETQYSWQEELGKTIKAVQKKELILLDARPSEEVGEQIENLDILNIPGLELEKNLNKIPKKKKVLVFCRGRFCALSAHVVNELREKGYEAYRLNESWYSIKKAV